MKSPLRGADLLARSLAAAGARHLFALSGNHVMPVFDAALDAKLSIVHVRHEAAAVHMADAWGRLTGEPGLRRAHITYSKARGTARSPSARRGAGSTGMAARTGSFDGRL